MKAAQSNGQHTLLSDPQENNGYHPKMKQGEVKDDAFRQWLKVT